MIRKPGLTNKKTAPAVVKVKRNQASRPAEANGQDGMVTNIAKLADVAYGQIEEAIVTLHIPPGTSVSELTLSKATGIGRTPIREAIQRLARENLILVLPQRGLLVPLIDVSKQLRLLETRRELERLVCRSAAKRSTPEQKKAFTRLAKEFTTAGAANDDKTFIRSDREFNELCLVAAHNEFSEGAMRLMHGLSRRFWYYHYKQAADLPEISRLHAAVARAIGNGDVAAAATACDRLMDNIEAFTRSTVMSNI